MRSNRSRTTVLILLLTTFSLLSWRAALGQDSDDQDAPGRVARLNLSQGTVSFQPGGENDWLAAVSNRPIVTGDNLWVDENSQAELHVGSTAVRLGPHTLITLLEINDRVVQIRLAQGSMILRIRNLERDDAYEVDTPNLVFSPLHTGEYRIDVSDSGTETIASVYHGQGEATGGGQAYHVLAGQQVEFNGANALDYDIRQLPRPDAFADWVFQRDAREDAAESANYVSREMTGYEDLDAYGQWRYVANYGPAWVPASMPVAWAPYRFGHWAWIQPWGWTWVDDEPWGFAPFHYGRWAYAGNVWCWVPGPVVVRPVYAPALVAFVGGGGFNLSLSLGGGPGVAWFPLAPGEVYVPPYRASPVYVRNINTTNTVVNVTKVTNVYNYYTTNNATSINRITYANQHITNGVTVVSHDTFVNARPVSRNLASVAPQTIEQAPVTHAAPVQPVRASMLGSGSATRAMPPGPAVNRPVVANRAAVPPPPAPFDRRQPWQGRSGTPVAPPSAEARNEGPVPLPTETRTSQARPVNPLPQSQVTTEAPPSQGFRPPKTDESQQMQRNNAAPANPHPLVKPATPVQPKTPQQWAEAETKNQKWQQQRSGGHPPDPRAEQERR